MAILWIITLFSVFAYSSQNEFFIKEAMTYMEHASQFLPGCLKESNITLKTLMGLKNFEDIITDEKYKCLVYCMSVKPGTIYTNGTLNINNVSSILEITDQNFLDQLNAKCKFPDLQEKCSAAQKTILCILQQFQINLK